MRKFLLTLAVLCGTVSGWAQIRLATTSIIPGKSYTLKCKATDHDGFLADKDGTLEGRATTQTNFSFESASEGKYYFKSLDSNKYVNVDGSKITIDTEAKTEWTVTYQFNAFSISSSDKNYLNNAAGTNYVQIKEHNPIGAGNACSLWIVSEELTISDNENNPIWYTIKNVRTQKYATYAGASSQMIQQTYLNAATLFYFTAGSNGTLKIHNYMADTKLCADYNSWTDEGIEWYLKNQSTGISISKNTDDDDTNVAWNDFQGSGQSVAYWNASDAGSAWVIEKYSGNVADLALTLSTPESKTFYNIKNHRSGKYVDFVGTGTAFQQKDAVEAGSYWYFVDAKSELPSETEIPKGTTVCRIYNAANALAVENASNGNMTANSGVPYPARLYFLRPYEHSGRCGYAIYPYNEPGAGWNDLNSSSICNYDYEDAGSIWYVIPANKTEQNLKDEAQATKSKYLAYLEADYYSFSAENKATVQEALNFEGSNLLSLMSTYVELNKCTGFVKGTTAPAAGNYIQLKNRNYNTYLQANGDGLNGIANVNNKNTLWLVEGVENSENVRLKNVATGKYIGEIRQSTNVSMVDTENAKEFAFTNQADCYAVIKETSGGSYAYAHIAGHNVLVGWEVSAAATQWVVSEFNATDLEATIAKANDYGKVGYYVKTDALTQAIERAQALVDAENAETSAIVEAWITLTDEMANITDVLGPTSGKFYRLKNAVSGNYMSSTADGIKMLTDGSNALSTVFYLNADNSLLSFNTGLYLDCGNKSNAAVGTSCAGEFYTACDGPTPNVLMYKNNGYFTYGDRADGVSVDRGSNTPNASQTGYNWTIEEVTWLPIPVNEDLGYATLYSPVQLELSYGRFKAYAANLNADGTALTLTELDAVPANTAVILELQKGATVENGCSYLQIQESTLSGVETQLQGTLSDSYVDGDAYILAKPEGYATGFYKAAKNYENGTKFLNNGFKAYLPAPVSGARFYVFDFGTETAIENIEGAESANDAVIYDLAGRRVQGAQKGLYIVNGKKVIK